MVRPPRLPLLIKGDRNAYEEVTIMFCKAGSWLDDYESTVACSWDHRCKLHTEFPLEYLSVGRM